MKNIVLPLVALTSLSVWATAPEVTPGSVVMTQDPISREVTITYALTGEPAIITMDIQTNNVSIGGKNLWYFRGDVNKVVEVGDHTVYWKPDKAWPNHKIDSGVTAVVTAWSTNTPPDYMAVNLAVPGARLFYANADSVPFGVSNIQYKTEYLLMRKIPAGHVQWRMGSPTEENGRKENETPHLVTLPSDYYIGVYELTQRQYEILTSSCPSSFANKAYYEDRPLETVTYAMIRGSANWPTDTTVGGYMGLLRNHSGLALDLPTEAQWEFANRGGSGHAFYNGGELPSGTAEFYLTYKSSELDAIARYKMDGGWFNTSKEPTLAEIATADDTWGTAPVGSYEPNGYGLYDTLGNVWEWCLDWYAAGIPADPMKGPSQGSARVMRGGSWSDTCTNCRSAHRNDMSVPNSRQHLGFRVCCPAVVP